MGLFLRFWVFLCCKEGGVFGEELRGKIRLRKKEFEVDFFLDIGYFFSQGVRVHYPLTGGLSDVQLHFKHRR